MPLTEAIDHLQSFRGAVYRTLGQRKDTLFELAEAALVSPSRATTVRLSLPPLYRRGWASAPTALRQGSVDGSQLQRLFQHGLAAAVPSARPVWAVDGTIWPRPAAHTSPERTWGHAVRPGRPQTGVVPAWEYQWLVDVPAPTGSWVRPLDVARRRPAAGTPTALAVAQVRTALAVRPVDAPRPVITADSQYDPIGLAQAGLAVDWLVRLTPRRRFYRPPGPYPGRGTRVRKHGGVFRLSDPTTQGPPAAQAETVDPAHGRVQVRVWCDLHTQWAVDCPLVLVCIRLARLPRRDRSPAPLWLAWLGGALPADLLDLWRWYRQRFTVEHGFRFLKQELGWTTVRPRAPEAADRWSWLLAAMLWELWLLRPIVADQRLPWEPPLPPLRLTPGRVRRAASGILAALSSPARPPRPRGKSPGRAPGQGPGPRQRYPVVRRHPHRPRHQRKRAV
jgi:hypothetical protein